MTSPDRSSWLGLASFAFILVIAGVIYLGVRRPSSHAPPPPPTPIGRDRVTPIRDDVEDLVYALEDMFETQRTAMVQFAPDQATALYTGDFAGDVFFDDAPWTDDLTLPHARTAARAATPGARPDLAKLARAFLARFDSIDAITYKFDGLDAPQGDEVRGITKVTFVGRKDGLPTEIFERYDAVFRRVAGAWKVASLKRSRATLKQGTRPVFVDATRALGLDVLPGVDCHWCSYDLPQIHNGGLAAGDYDGDGDLDLFVTRLGQSLLMRNDGGRFADATAGSGLERKAAAAGALWLDVDNDGDLDLLVTAACQPGDCSDGCALALYRNDGGGRFTDVTEKALGRRRGPATSACAADVDGDGDLDLFVAMYGEPKKVESTSQKVFTRSYVRARDGVPDLLFINKGDGTFEERGAKAGVADTGWGFACVFFDADGNGAPDLYVVNDFGEHVFFRNRGDGTFEDATSKLGVRDVGFGMGASLGDYDRDGDVDLYVSNMYSTAGNRILKKSPEIPEDLRRRLLKMAQGNSMLRNNGDGTFAEVGVETGTNSAGWAWGNPFLDYDEDGWPDLYVANGFSSGRARKDL